MDIASEYETLTSTLKLEVVGAEEDSCKGAIANALTLLSEKLPSSILSLISETQITIDSGLIEGGGQTYAEEKKIILDKDKNELSLQVAENYLVEANYLKPGDWTKALPSSKNNKWSCLTYQLIHEFGHLIDGLLPGKVYERLSKNSSPSQYGKSSSTEAFAEVFAYWVFGLKLESDVKSTLTTVIQGAR